MSQPRKPRRRWLRWTLGGIGALFVASVVAAALTDPGDEQSPTASASEATSVPSVADGSEPEVAATEPLDDASTEVSGVLPCSAWDPPIPYTTSMASCAEALARGNVFAHQVGLADAPESPAATIAFISICDALQGSEPKTYESPANYDLAVLLNDSGVCPGDLAMLVPIGGLVELTPCEQAWEQGLGNAQAPGTVQEDWIAGCRAEGGDNLDLSAIQEAEAAAPPGHCETVRKTLEVAVEAHWATYGEGPSNQDELLDRGFILSVDPDFMISSDGNGVVAAPGSRCQ